MDDLEYLGHVSMSDPIWGYLCHEIFPSLGLGCRPKGFRVFKPRVSGRLYIYEETSSGARVVGKFFAEYKGAAFNSAAGAMEREFSNMLLLREMGFCSYPHYVARPLGRKREINCLLVEEYCWGTRMDKIILSALREGGTAILFEKLKALSLLLARLHNQTAKEERVDFKTEADYLSRVLGKLSRKGIINEGTRLNLTNLRDWWTARPYGWEDCQVLVHGDVTPSNIMFGDELWVIVTDLERMRYSDRAFDLGMVAAELKHFFLQYGGGHADPEPFIGHFLWEYACHFPDRERAFDAITRRLPFYMGLSLLRIARNNWIEPAHRARLVEEAQKTLR
jgi:hypothetical protein